MIERMIQTDDREEALGILQKRTEERTDQTYDLPKKRRQYKEKDNDSLSPAEAGIAIPAFSSGASEDGRSTADGQTEELNYILPVIRKSNRLNLPAYEDRISGIMSDGDNEKPEKVKKTSQTIDNAADEEVPFLDQVFSGNEKKPPKETKKTGKKAGRRSMAADGIMNNLGMTLAENKDKVSAVMAELMKVRERLALVNKQLYIYDQESGCFEMCGRDDAAMRIRSMIPKELKNRISYSDYKQAYQLLRISEEIEKKDNFFSFNTHYVNCGNGVYDALHGTLVPHSHRYAFTNCLEANYDPDAGCPRWIAYLDCITCSDPELKRLWRCVIGYLLSNYNNAKVGILVYGASNTGKSVMCNLIERFFGSKKVSHVDISLFGKPELAAHTANKILNVVPDLNNTSLTDVGRLKSLLSHLDTQSLRLLYGNPVEVKSQTKMLFATNHELTFDVKKCSPNDIEAIFNRMLYIPYVNAPVPKSQMNRHLADQLWAERNGILTWAMTGLQDYLDCGENFPYAEKSEELKAHNAAQYCPEMGFVDRYIAEAEGEWISTRDLRNAYSAYCRANGVVSTGKLSILTYVEEHLGIRKIRGRVKDANDNEKNCWHFKNLRLLWVPEDAEEEESEAYDEEYDA